MAKKFGPIHWGTKNSSAIAMALIGPATHCTVFAQPSLSLSQPQTRLPGTPVMPRIVNVSTASPRGIPISVVR